jgi:hypothetical protein
MWELWSKALEALGRLRLPTAYGRTKVLVGSRDAMDAQGSGRWRDYLSPEKLYDVWGPPAGSPWAPFHCVPLFAALDRIRAEDIGPAPGPDAIGGPPGGPPPGVVRPVLPRHAQPGASAPVWLTSETWTILDLPGPLAVEAAVWLILSAGCQPACTFDNWPHPKGLLRVEDTLAELLRWAGTVADTRVMIGPGAPPLWICDSERLGTRAGSPGEFDNRYYLDDSVLPGDGLLKKEGVRRVIYVTLAEPDIPTVDLEVYFAELLTGGIPVEHVELSDPTLTPYALAMASAPRPLRREDFRRSAAGGFGSEVPQPSSGGS